MTKKKVVIGALLAVGLIVAYEFYKSNLNAYDFSLNKSEVVDKETMTTMNEEELFFTKPINKPQVANIKIYKEMRILELYGDDKLIGRFKIALGGAPIGDKDKEGDRKTPEGKYYICTRNDKSKYTLFLGLSYPNTQDAEKGLEKGLIDKLAFKEIRTEIENKRRPDWNTPLGGAVGIHGGGTSSDWTWGCIALSDEDIKIIWEYTKMNTPVEIYK